MLVLSRKRDERVLLTIGDAEVEVCVVALRGDKVRLGFDAPPEVRIMRTELIDRTDETPPRPEA